MHLSLRGIVVLERDALVVNVHIKWPCKKKEPHQNFMLYEGTLQSQIGLKNNHII